jgi:hypothetical protein
MFLPPRLISSESAKNYMGGPECQPPIKFILFPPGHGEGLALPGTKKFTEIVDANRSLLVKIVEIEHHLGSDAIHGRVGSPVRGTGK